MSLSPGEQVPTYRSNRGRLREGFTFELSSLSTEEIKRLAHAIGLERRERLNRSELDHTDRLFDLLGIAFSREVAALPLDEAKELVRDLAADGDDHARGLAAYGVTVLVKSDWEFARDTLVDLITSPDGEGYMGASYASEDLPRMVTPEQYDDYYRHYVARRSELRPGF